MRSYDSPGRTVTLVNAGPGAVAVLGDQPYRLREHQGITADPSGLGEPLTLVTEGVFMRLVEMVPGVDSARDGDLVHLATDGSWRLVAGLGQAGADGFVPFGLLGDTLVRKDLARVKLMPATARAVTGGGGGPAFPAIIVGRPSDYDPATGKAAESPVPVDPSQLLLSDADGQFYRRTTVTTDVYLPPDYQQQSITFDYWALAVSRYILSAGPPDFNPVAQAANPAGDIPLRLSPTWMTAPSDFVNGSRMTPATGGATYIELDGTAPFFQPFQIEARLYGIVGGTPQDIVELVQEQSSDGGETWTGAIATSAAARVGDTLHFLSEVQTGSSGRLSLRYVSTAEVTFKWLQFAITKAAQ